MKEAKAWIKVIEARQAAIAKERDKLDTAIADMEELRECCACAWDDLQSARDALSKLV